LDDQVLLDTARRVIELEAQAVRGLLDQLDARFVAAARLVHDCRGRVVVTGLGKSGHVGRKIAATLASVGTPAFFVHASEALHGDLGMIKREDVVLAISHSGETTELLACVPVFRHIGAKLVTLTDCPDSTLAKQSDVALDLGVRAEADPRGVAPTSSAITALALGDALALAVSVARGFTRQDFARLHPGGSLGKQLTE